LLEGGLSVVTMSFLEIDAVKVRVVVVGYGGLHLDMLEKLDKEGGVVFGVEAIANGLELARLSEVFFDLFRLRSRHYIIAL
jgi:hypothetical protein